MKKTEGFVSLEDGLKLHYCSIGTGLKIVIIPAKVGLVNDLEILADERRLIFYDQRGRGNSDTDPDSTNIWSDYEVTDLEAVRNHFGQEKISLIGWSYNGAMSALFAAGYPDRVDRLVMMCPIPPRSDAPYRDPNRAKLLGESRVDHGEAKRLSEMENKGLDKSDPKAYCREYMKVNLPRQMGRPECLENMQSDPCYYPNEWPHNKSEHTRLHIPEESLVWDWCERVVTVKAPTLVIHGEEDLIPIESSREWVKVLPHARLLTIQGSGHFPHLEAPEIYFPAVRKFLGGEWPEGVEEVT